MWITRDPNHHNPEVWYYAAKSGIWKKYGEVKKPNRWSPISVSRVPYNEEWLCSCFTLCCFLLLIGWPTNWRIIGELSGPLQNPTGFRGKYQRKLIVRTFKDWKTNALRGSSKMYELFLSWNLSYSNRSFISSYNGFKSFHIFTD
jgi:hypothetical protein